MEGAPKPETPKILIIADNMQAPLVRECLVALSAEFTVVTLGTNHDEKLIKECDFCVVVNAYSNGWALKVTSMLVDLNKTILAFPADAWRYSGKGCNFLIQTGNAQIVASVEDIFSFVDNRVILEK